jgi:ABC-type multidrug transport system ATPase subunit
MTIRFEKLSKYYLESCALKDATGKINSGEKLLILGDNGSGKSTFLKLISGQIAASAGEIYLDDSKLCNDFRKRFSILGELKLLYFDLTLKENFKLLLQTEVERKAAQSLCAELSLDYSSKSTLRQFSSGQRQKATLIRALSLNSEILVLDEPLNFLDSDSKKKVASAITRSEKTTVLVSHESDYFPQFRQAEIKRGVLSC